MPAVCFIVGARPNFMKVAPVHRALAVIAPDIESILVHTGQHYDAAMSDVFVRELGLPEPDSHLGVGSGSHAEQTARALVAVEQVLIARRPELVVVAGDVNSTLAAALAAVKLDIPVAHIEAGLRSFDTTMPEEHNRVLTDHLSAVLLSHSQHAVANLEVEGIPHDRINLVGNTMIDSVLEHVARAREAAPWKALGLETRSYVLVTLHRPALVDDDDLLTRTARSLAVVTRELPVVFAVHPRTHERLVRLGLESQLLDAQVKLLGPLGYLDFLGLEAEAAAVVTDSGGIQEETSALGIRCFTLRSTTERPVTVELGTNTVIGLQPERIESVPSLLALPHTSSPIPLWDGHAGVRAARVLAAYVR